MRNYIITLFLLVACLLSATAQENTAIKIWTSNDSFHAYNLSSDPTLEHNIESLTIKTKRGLSGTYELKDGLKITFSELSAVGDVNGDNSVTMADANVVVNVFLGAKANNINVTSADVNGDGNITMADANQVVNMFLEK